MNRAEFALQRKITHAFICASDFPLEALRDSCDMNWTPLCPSPLQIIKCFSWSCTICSLEKQEVYQISHDLGNSKVFHRL